MISNVALIATNAAFGGTDNIDGGVVGVSTLLAVILGGWLAAKLAGRFGLYQGIVVAIGFIAVGAIYTFFQESSIIAASLSTNSHHLIDLGPWTSATSSAAICSRCSAAPSAGCCQESARAEGLAGRARNTRRNPGSSDPNPQAPGQTPTAPACAG